MLHTLVASLTKSKYLENGGGCHFSNIRIKIFEPRNREVYNCTTNEITDKVLYSINFNYFS